MIQIVDKKRFFLMIIIVAAMIAGIIWGILKLKGFGQKAQIYEALVMIADQKNPDPVEDARSSLKKGDVIAIFPEGHNWSDTEKISYLIVKLKITPNEAGKLVQPKTKEIKKEAPKNADGKEIDAGPQQETILAREYRLNLPDFDVQKFWSEQKQPFEGKVFDSGIIDKK